MCALGSYPDAPSPIDAALKTDAGDRTGIELHIGGHAVGRDAECVALDVTTEARGGRHPSAEARTKVQARYPRDALPEGSPDVQLGQASRARHPARGGNPH